ncbi:HAD-IIIC family phosphatase [Desulfovibrio sp. OttesenSCG-928-O18]|nr:HAD-IIIC family phosphatase [Desulfovibrio sp. OttesenSCG-928-O18]
MRKTLELAKDYARSKEYDRARSCLRNLVGPDCDYVLLRRMAKWAQSIAWPGTRKLRVALLGGGTLEELRDTISFWTLLEGVDLEVYLAPYDTWRMETLNPASSLYKFSPDVVWFFLNHRDIHLASSPAATAEKASHIATTAAHEMQAYWNHIQKHLPRALVFQNVLDHQAEREFGTLEVSLPGSQTNLQKQFNECLVKMASAQQVRLFDLEFLAHSQGLQTWHDPRYWYHSKHPFSPSLTGFVAYFAAKALLAALGLSKKLIVLDLDNTLWGGVIGDDGLEGIRLGNKADGEAFVAFQKYLLALNQRGIVLAVASKNIDQTAKLPFEQHPDMALTLDNIAVFKANWRNKADNIREIAQTINLGLDSFVFLDDNPAERALVRNELPEVLVPEMPEDPSHFVSFLDRLALFEMATFSDEDAQRAKMYKENVQRAESFVQSSDINSFLSGLAMKATCGNADPFTIPRMAQLVNKSNQFHPTTTRYSETALTDLAKQEDFLVRWYALEDRFGNYGLIAILILRSEDNAFIIDTWAMSCRVLERGMEEFILRDLITQVEGKKGNSIIGDFIPSAKNSLVANLYGRLGFNLIKKFENGATRWMLQLPCDRSHIDFFIENTSQ